MTDGMVWFHGTRACLSPGDIVLPGNAIGVSNYEEGWNDDAVWITRNLPEAQEWAEAARGTGDPVVYAVWPDTEPEDWAEINGWDDSDKTHDEWITTKAVVIENMTQKGSTP